MLDPLVVTLDGRPGVGGQTTRLRYGARSTQIVAALSSGANDGDGVLCGLDRTAFRHGLGRLEDVPSHHQG
jgi:hypothetical protein